MTIYACVPFINKVEMEINQENILDYLLFTKQPSKLIILFNGPLSTLNYIYNRTTILKRVKISVFNMNYTSH